MGQQKPFKNRWTRIAMAMIVTPQVLASGLRADVLLIHDHHGEIAHAHLIERQYRDTFDPHDDHHQGEHYHNHDAASESDCSEKEHGCNIFEITLASGFLTQRSRSEVATSIHLCLMGPIGPSISVQPAPPNDALRDAQDAPSLREHRHTAALINSSNAILI